MGRIDKTVFISYRRSSIPWALAIFQDLTHHGYDVFFDFNGIASGDFESVILENIRARAHFLVLLTPTALERCGQPTDWLRREIEAALDNKRNIIPLLLENFDFESAVSSGQLSGRLGILGKYNALPVPAAYFSEAMNRLREKYLSVPLEIVLQPASGVAQQAAHVQHAKAMLVGMQRRSDAADRNEGHFGDYVKPDSRGRLNPSNLIIARKLEGSWTDTFTDSRFYARLLSGRLLIPYCYGGNSQLNAHIFDVSFQSAALRGYFEWAPVLEGDRPLRGAILFHLESILSSPAADVLQGGWWYAQDLPKWPNHPPVTPNTPKMYPLNLQRISRARCPEWAERYFERARQRRRWY
ncbi:MAG: toll/interleukin-1 receptor domain-containing protein [Terracidiphilus sp.]|jgi:hypothetical protein